MNLNYECHVTCVAPSNVLMQGAYERIAFNHRWKTSTIDGDPSIGAGKKFYFTRNGVDYIDVWNRMHALADELNLLVPGRVLREKIELILHDVRHERPGIGDGPHPGFLSTTGAPE